MEWEKRWDDQTHCNRIVTSSCDDELGGDGAPLVKTWGEKEDFMEDLRNDGTRGRLGSLDESRMR